MNAKQPGSKRATKATRAADRGYNDKQMGDAAEMLVAAELTLHGRPSFIVPAGWPGYDVVAQLPGAPLQRISVKSRGSTNFIDFDPDTFDWRPSCFSSKASGVSL